MLQNEVQLIYDKLLDMLLTESIKSFDDVAPIDMSNKNNIFMLKPNQLNKELVLKEN